MIPQAELDAMRARAEAATRGPWVTMAHSSAAKKGTTAYGVWPQRRGAVSLATFHPGHAEEDAAFIAAARSDVPRLLDAYEELRTLARELAVRLAQVHVASTTAESVRDGYREALAKARDAGLLP